MRAVLLLLLPLACSAGGGWREQASKFFYRPRPVQWPTDSSDAAAASPQLEITNIDQHKHRSHDFRVIVHEGLRGIAAAGKPSSLSAAAEIWWGDRVNPDFLSITGRKPRPRNGQDVTFCFAAPGKLAAAACDGHGSDGSRQAEGACRELMARARKAEAWPQQLIAFPPQRGPVLHDEVVQWFSNAMSGAHRATIDGRLSGTTATMIVAAAADPNTGRRVDVLDSHSHIVLAVSNVGDTRAALFQFDGVVSPAPTASRHYSVKRLTDEHSYSREIEMAHAERQLLRLGMREGLSLIVRGLLGTTSMRVFGEEQIRFRLEQEWSQAKQNFATGDAVIRKLLRLAKELQQPIWALTRLPLLRGSRAVVRLFHPGGTMMELEPSASFGDAWMKPVQRQFPDSIRGARLVPSTDSSSLLVMASDGVWEVFDNARGSEDRVQSDVRLADVLAKGAAAGGSLAAGLLEVYNYARTQGSKDDITIHAWWFPNYEVSPLLPSTSLPYDVTAEFHTRASAETTLQCPFSNPGVEARRVAPQPLPPSAEANDISDIDPEPPVGDTDDRAAATTPTAAATTAATAPPPPLAEPPPAGAAAANEDDGNAKEQQQQQQTGEEVSPPVVGGPAGGSPPAVAAAWGGRSFLSGARGVGVIGPHDSNNNRGA